MSLPRLPDIWYQGIGKGDLYHWFPVHADLSLCHEWRREKSERKTHCDLNTGNVCPECMNYFSNAVFRGEPVEEMEDE